MQCDGTGCINCLLKNAEHLEKEESNKNPRKELKPVFHLATLSAQTEEKVGTVPSCSRRIYSLTHFNQSRH